MKTCIVLLILSFAASSYQQIPADVRAQFHAKRDACIKETNVNEEVLKKAFMEGVYADDKNLKCFFKCMGQKTGMMNAAGALDVDAMKSHIPAFMDKAKAVAAIDKCKGATASTDPCEIAFEYSKCFHKEIGPMPKPPAAGN